MNRVITLNKSQIQMLRKLRTNGNLLFIGSSAPPHAWQQLISKGYVYEDDNGDMAIRDDVLRFLDGIEKVL